MIGLGAMRKSEIALELRRSERAYLLRLAQLVEGYVRPLEDEASVGGIEATDEQIGTICQYLIPIQRLHSLLLNELTRNATNIVETLTKFVTGFEVYCDYCLEFEPCLRTFQTIKKDPNFMSLMISQQKLLKGHPGMISLLTLPLRRVDSYIKIVKAILSAPDTHDEEAQMMERALSVLNGYKNVIDQSKYWLQASALLLDIEGIPSRVPILRDDRYLVHRGACVWMKGDNDAAAAPVLMPVNLLLFSDFLVWSSRDKPAKYRGHLGLLGTTDISRYKSETNDGFRIDAKDKSSQIFRETGDELKTAVASEDVVRGENSPKVVQTGDDAAPVELDDEEEEEEEEGKLDSLESILEKSIDLQERIANHPANIGEEEVKNTVMVEEEEEEEERWQQQQQQHEEEEEDLSNRSQHQINNIDRADETHSNNKMPRREKTTTHNDDEDDEGDGGGAPSLPDLESTTILHQNIDDNSTIIAEEKNSDDDNNHRYDDGDIRNSSAVDAAAIATTTAAAAAAVTIASIDGNETSATTTVLNASLDPTHFNKLAMFNIKKSGSSTHGKRLGSSSGSSSSSSSGSSSNNRNSGISSTSNIIRTKALGGSGRSSITTKGTKKKMRQSPAGSTATISEPRSSRSTEQEDGVPDSAIREQKHGPDREEQVELDLLIDTLNIKINELRSENAELLSLRAQIDHINAVIIMLREDRKSIEKLKSTVQKLQKEVSED
eukprot:jgi/Bigna1/139946/aug1.53_g14654